MLLNAHYLEDARHFAFYPPFRVFYLYRRRELCPSLCLGLYPYPYLCLCPLFLSGHRLSFCHDLCLDGNHDDLCSQRQKHTHKDPIIGAVHTPCARLSLSLLGLRDRLRRFLPSPPRPLPPPREYRDPESRSRLSRSQLRSRRRCSDGLEDIVFGVSEEVEVWMETGSHRSGCAQECAGRDLGVAMIVYLLGRAATRNNLSDEPGLTNTLPMLF